MEPQKLITDMNNQNTIVYRSWVLSLLGSKHIQNVRVDSPGVDDWFQGRQKLCTPEPCTQTCSPDIPPQSRTERILYAYSLIVICFVRLTLHCWPLRNWSFPHNFSCDVCCASVSIPLLKLLRQIEFHVFVFNDKFELNSFPKLCCFLVSNAFHFWRNNN